MSKIMNFPKAAAPEQGDGVCQEADGCPTERAVLQRFWREHQITLKDKSVIDNILQDTYETDPTYLARSETIVIGVNNLRQILENRIGYSASIASALPAQPSQRELDARVELEVKAGLWDEVRIICVPHGAGVDKPITEWLADRLAAPALPAAPDELNVETQYENGIHIGSGLPRATCPCGFCEKYRIPALPAAQPGESDHD